MALIKCEKCGKLISDKASNCPHCGDKKKIIKNKVKFLNKKVILIPIVIVVAIAMLFLFAVGQGVILIIAGLFTSGVKNLRKFANFSDMLLKISGTLLILVALYLYYKTFAPIV